MAEYHVNWQIEVEAVSLEDAARKAMLIQQNPESIAHVYEVTNLDRPGGSATVEVDLDAIENEGGLND